MSYSLKAEFLEKVGSYYTSIDDNIVAELEQLEKIGYYCKHEEGRIILRDTLVTEMSGDLPELAKEYLKYKKEGYEDMGMAFKDYASDDISEEEERGLKEAYEYFGRE